MESEKVRSNATNSQVSYLGAKRNENDRINAEREQSIIAAQEVFKKGGVPAPLRKKEEPPTLKHWQR